VTQSSQPKRLLFFGHIGSNDRTLDRLAKRGKIARIPTPFIRPRLWSRRSIIQFLESAK
jgi:hypothetical protein